MLRLLKCLFRAGVSALKTRQGLVFEVLALTHQLAVVQQIAPKRPKLTIWDRWLWVCLSKAWGSWRKHLIIVHPDTVVGWHRQGFRLYWQWKSRHRKPGRARIDAELRNLICEMARENLWRAPRIHKELVRLGFDVSQRTVARYIPNPPRSPAARQSWRTFLRNHRHEIAAMDLFVVPTVTFRLVYGFFVIHHDRRRVLHANVTEHPTSAWVIQQLREAFSWESTAKFLICDRDSIFSATTRGAIKSMGITVKQTAYKSPWQNGVAERWIGCVRQGLLHHVIVLNDDHLRRLLLAYVSYHNNDRLHCTLAGDAPNSRALELRPTPMAKTIAQPRLGGLHHRYAWRQAA